MKKLLITSFLCCAVVLFSAVIAYPYQIITNFQIGFQPIRDNIVLRWKSVDESAVSAYIIERSTDNFNFNSIGSVSPRGNNTEYKFIDSNIFKTAARTFYYRLQIQKKDGTFIFTKVVHLSPRISGVKQTWGSIKAIFH